MAVVSPTPKTFALPTESSQQIIIESSVLAHLARHRQRTCLSREAGGQLFGKVSSDEVRVLMASGPYPGDVRQRFSYRSNPKAAQQEIDGMAIAELLYIGEWHTHPERLPVASILDHKTIRALHSKSRLRVSSLVLLIQGTKISKDGLAVYSIGTGGLTRWSRPEP